MVSFAYRSGASEGEVSHHASDGIFDRGPSGMAMADLRLRGRDRRGITSPLPDNRRRRGSRGGAACAHECGRPSEGGGSWRLDKPCAPPGPHPLRQFGPCRHVAILGLRCSVRRATAEVGPAWPHASEAAAEYSRTSKPLTTSRSTSRRSSWWRERICLESLPCARLAVNPW